LQEDFSTLIAQIQDVLDHLKAHLENQIVVIDVHKLNEVKVNGDHLVIHWIDEVNSQFVEIKLIRFSKIFQK
jgi:hypothetical protein